MRKVRLSVAFAATLFVIAGQRAQCQSAPKQKEQRVFSAEDERVNRPVVVPAAILALLAKDGDVGDAVEREKTGLTGPPASWFSAAQVQLGSKGKEDFIVMGVGPLRGANIIPFWVFLHDHRGFRLVLADRALDLEVERVRSRGYRDIQANSATAGSVTTVKFRFNGYEYKNSREKTTDIQ